jgi:anti-anti-sigma regulatory factor
MTLKIEQTVDRESTVVTLSGRMEAAHIPELETLLNAGPGRAIILDLRELRLADRDAVRFLASCEASGITLKNCPLYIREWIQRERE